MFENFSTFADVLVFISVHSKTDTWMRNFCTFKAAGNFTLEFEKFCKINLKNAMKLWFRGVKTIVHFSILYIHKFTCPTFHFLFICCWKFIAFIKLMENIFWRRCITDGGLHIEISLSAWSTHNWTWMNLFFITVFYHFMSIMMFLSLWWSHTKLLGRHQFVFASINNSPQNPHCLAIFSIIRVLWDAICRVFVSLIWKKNVTALFLSASPLLFVPFRSYLFAVITKSNCCRFLLSMIDLRLKVVA
jgi:hypothetical protein